MSWLQNLRIYREEVGKLRCANPARCRFFELARFFLPWSRSLAGGINALIDERPWLTFAAILFLRRRLTPAMRVFEWGSGGSTLFFSARAREVVTVEHDPDWAERVRTILTRKGRANARVHLVEPTPEATAAALEPADPASHISSAPCYRGLSFHRYAAQIDAYPDRHFDWVVVDGRARPSCLDHARPKVKQGGYLLLDDAERAHYQRAVAALRELRWRQCDFSGPGPYTPAFRRTCAWQSP